MKNLILATVAVAVLFVGLSAAYATNRQTIFGQRAASRQQPVNIIVNGGHVQQQRFAPVQQQRFVPVHQQVVQQRFVPVQQRFVPVPRHVFVAPQPVVVQSQAVVHYVQQPALNQLNTFSYSPGVAAANVVTVPQHYVLPPQQQVVAPQQFVAPQQYAAPQPLEQQNVQPQTYTLPPQRVIQPPPQIIQQQAPLNQGAQYLTAPQPQIAYVTQSRLALTSGVCNAGH